MSSSQYNRIQVRRHKSNTFKMVFDNKFSTNFGRLTPIFVKEVLPNDVWNIRTSTLVRFAPMMAPIMHNVDVFVHYFFVPNRIVWSGWEDFISPDLVKSTPPAWPHLLDPGPFDPGSLPDYLGLPTDVQLPGVSAIPFAGYQKIYQEYYRDQNLENDVNCVLVNGSNNSNSDLWQLRYRAFEHDYFTSNLPFAQKGPAVELPLGEFPDVGIIKYDPSPSSGVDSWVTAEGHAFVGVSSDVEAVSPNEDYLYADTSSLTATAATINDLRVAMRLQEWFELAARGGSRYTEQLRSFWGAFPKDSRLQRPEFLGGSKARVIISEVLQTSGTIEGTDDTPQATMAGHGISASNGKYVRYRADEHGFLFGILSIMPRTAYFQGIHRQWSRTSWDDYAWPQFAHLGEQATLNKEIYVGNDGLDDDVFGYMPRYSEYRSALSEVHGDFRTSLKFWHMAREFSSRPNLNSTFIKCTPTSDDIGRIFAVRDSTDKLWCCAEHVVFAKRNLPKYGTPAL